MGVRGTPKRCTRAVALALLVLEGSVTTTVVAASYPDRPNRLVVPSAAGGGPDTVSERLDTASRFIQANISTLRGRSPLSWPPSP